MLASLSLAFLTAAALQQGPTATVHGQVRSEATGTPLSGAAVEIVAAGVSKLATTDSVGTYVIKNIPVGRRLVRATHIDHAPLEVEIVIAERTDMVLDFTLELRPVKLPAITAQALSWKSNKDTIAAGSAALGQASVKVLESSPGVADLGVAQVTREVPGQESPDPSDVLYVRGGITDLKLVLLNGAPVYAPFHLGGLINPLDGDLMRAARLYVGGAPARYDGGLSYVMDMETRAGRAKQSHNTLSVDMLSARTVMEGPMSKHSTYLLGMRDVHGLGTQSFIEQPFPYGYADAITRFDVDVGQSRITASGFWNRESVRMDSLASGGSEKSANWGNLSGSLRFRGDVLGTDAEITAAAGQFHTQLPIGGVRPIITDGIANRMRFSANFTHTYGGVNMQYGASFDQQHYEYNAWPQSATRDSLLLRSNADGDVTGFYVDAEWHPIARVTLRTGARGDAFSKVKAPRFAPRLSATLLLTEKASLTLAGGTYRQFVRAESGSGFIGTPVVDTVGRPSLEVAKATHFVLSLDQDLGDGLRLALEGYYKQFDGLPSTNGKLTEASGVDLWVRRGTGRITGWLGYSLAWIWSEDGDAVSSTHVFAGRQLLSAGASGQIGTNGRFDIHLAYGAGLPFTAIPEPEAAPPAFAFVGMKPSRVPGTVPDDNFNTPTPPDAQYMRVDAEFSHTFVADIRGFAFELMPYIKVLNALDRRDALFYHFDRSQQAPTARAIAALPVLPIVGLEWRF